MQRTNQQPASAARRQRNHAAAATSAQLVGCSEFNDVLPRDQVRLMLSEAAARQVFDTEGAAEYLGVSRQLLELMRVSGGGPRYAKLGRLVRYRRPSLDEWLIERERTHTSEERL
jgi:hypothetical protein